MKLNRLVLSATCVFLAGIFSAQGGTWEWESTIQGQQFSSISDDDYDFDTYSQGVRLNVSHLPGSGDPEAEFVFILPPSSAGTYSSLSIRVFGQGTANLWVDGEQQSDVSVNSTYEQRSISVTKIQQNADGYATLTVKLQANGVSTFQLGYVYVYLEMNTANQWLDYYMREILSYKILLEGADVIDKFDFGDVALNLVKEASLKAGAFAQQLLGVDSTLMIDALEATCNSIEAFADFADTLTSALAWNSVQASYLNGLLNINNTPSYICTKLKDTYAPSIKNLAGMWLTAGADGDLSQTDRANLQVAMNNRAAELWGVSAADYRVKDFRNGWVKVNGVHAAGDDDVWDWVQSAFYSIRPLIYFDIPPRGSGTPGPQEDKSFLKKYSDELLDHAASIVPNAPKISGKVSTSGGDGIDDVNVSANNGGGSNTTDSNGNYELTVPYDWSGNVTASKAGYILGSYWAFEHVTGDQIGKDFTGTPIEPEISGYVKTASGSAISGVSVSANNGGDSDTTDSSGYYELGVPYNWSGTLTASKSGFSFSSKNYSNITSDQIDQNFTGLDVDPPDEVSGFSAVAGDTTVRLTWSNPGDGDFDGVKIMRKTGGYPSDEDDGTQVYDGSSTEKIDTGLSNSTKYYYKAFSYDTSDNYASGSSANATPYEILTHYVSVDGSHTWPFENSDSAATNIQDAINVATSNDAVLVNDGIYAIQSTISVGKEIVLQSINGPKVTTIDAGTHDYLRFPCISVSTPALIAGFTITNGVNTGNFGGGIKSSYDVGWALVVSNCVIGGNSAANGGGGLMYGTAIKCTFVGNKAQQGGAMYNCKAYNCILEKNVAHRADEEWPGGGGMVHGEAHNCTFSYNSSASYGGGMSYGEAYHCTFAGNVATYGGGVARGSTYNCIVLHNTASNSADDLYSTAAYYSCSPDLIHGEDGNITNAPLLVSASHIATNSPCRGAGDPAYASGTDIDGEAWLNPPSMGCDEYYAGTDAGQLDVEFLYGQTNLCVGFSGRYVFDTQGAVTETQIDFGDGEIVTNTVFVQHMWDVPGTYDVVLTAFNDDYPAGVSVTQAVHVFTAEESAVYVFDFTGNDANDGQSWATAKKTIQAGVDVQDIYGGMVLVSNGTYSISSEITVPKTMRIFSVNGPEVTVVDGGGITRCFNLSGKECVVSGFTITNGYADSDGGGIYCTDPAAIVSSCLITGNAAAGNGGGVYCTDPAAIISNCVISGNSAAGNGGGMVGSIAYDCTFRGNSATNESSGGGGMYGGLAYNCSFTDNSADRGGGASEGIYTNCIFIGNFAFVGGGIFDGNSYNSYFYENSAIDSGGGMYGGNAYNCILVGNVASLLGGGADECDLYNCVLYGNEAFAGGGSAEGRVRNCIAWSNSAIYIADNLYGSVTYSCAPDLIHGEDGNITNAPLLVSASHIATNSPCRGAGDPAYASGTDIDGEAWLNPPSMGCDEYYGSGSVTGSLELVLYGPDQICEGYPAQFIPQVCGAVTATHLSFGDGQSANNPILLEHTWDASGSYDVVLTAFNDDYPTGISVTQAVHVFAAEESAVYVSDSTGSDANDGQSWATAKKTIQAGVDAQAVYGGEVQVFIVVPFPILASSKMLICP